MRVGTAGDLIDFIEEDDTVLLHIGQRIQFHLVIIDQLGRFFIDQQLQCFADLQLAWLLATTAQAEHEIEKVIKYGAEFIFSNEQAYPQPLLNIPDHPPVLTTLGNKNFLTSDKIVAVVGARNASINGKKFASLLAQGLGKSGIIIASGLARGIDFAAHSASIKTGSIAIIAGGIDHVYPQENKEIYHELSKHGVIVAELPIGTAPRAQHFPQRNRLISGISKAVAIVEAANKSGSLITAKFAALQGKGIFAVPGFPFDARYAGTNYLIKQGARLLEHSNDILEYLGHITNIEDLNDSSPQAKQNASTETELDRYRLILLNSLNYNPVTLDEIIQFTAIPIDILNILLVELELGGRIERTFGNHFNLIR